MLHIYTGDGKGKTTAATGLLIRASGSGKKCAYCSFLKDGNSSEVMVLRKIDNITVFDFPEKVGFTWQMTELEKNELSRFYDKILNEILNSDFEVLVLDEAMDAICAGIIEEEKILKLLSGREVIITGRGACEKLRSVADYITVMKKEKHPFDKGMKARKGIEY